LDDIAGEAAKLSTRFLRIISDRIESSGGESSAFDALHPEGYIIDVQYVPLAKIGPQLI